MGWGIFRMRLSSFLRDYWSDIGIIIILLLVDSFLFAKLVPELVILETNPELTGFYLFMVTFSVIVTLLAIYSIKLPEMITTLRHE